MQVPKPTTADKVRFQTLVPDDPGVEVRPMFGNLGAFVQGNMFMGLLGAQIGLKLPDADADQLRSSDGAGAFGPVGRPMGGWVELPAPLVGTPEGDRWIARALEHVRMLPPKASKRSTKAPASKGSSTSPKTD
jgi:hypothetical protein